MATRILLVEGPDDLHVIKNLCKARGLPCDERGYPTDFTIEAMGGIDIILEHLPIRLKESGLGRLAVVLDANERLQQRWEQLRGRLLASGCEALPEAPDPSGTLVHAVLPHARILVGVWLMPDNVVPGVLEKFVAFLVPESDQLMPQVDAFLAGLPDPAMLPARFPAKDLPKARIHSWLAVQKEPGMPLGLAITARYLDPDRHAATPFMKWLRRALVD